MIGRLSAELPAAAAAVTGFWGPDWPREIVVVVTESTEQFRVLAHGSPDIAAATTADGIVFAPGAADMSDTALRIVVRHELFHYAARGQTVADAPLWVTEGVADYVGRPAAAAPGPERAELLARLPEDTDLPWHRVVSQPGRIAARGRFWGALAQADRLRAEGVAVDQGGLLDLEAHRWNGEFTKAARNR